MDLIEIRQRLTDALSVRVPRFDPNESPGVKIAALEDHLLKCVWHKGELEEALYWTLEAGKALKLQWDGISGYEVSLPRGTKHTKEQVDAAKRVIQPGIWDSLEECRFLVENLRRQISRLGGTDYDAVSRAYTLISGG
jgi:hypothetical protein